MLCRFEKNKLKTGWMLVFLVFFFAKRLDRCGSALFYSSAATPKTELCLLGKVREIFYLRNLRRPEKPLGSRKWKIETSFRTSLGNWRKISDFDYRTFTISDTWPLWTRCISSLNVLPTKTKTIVISSKRSDVNDSRLTIFTWTKSNLNCWRPVYEPAMYVIQRSSLNLLK